jgi:enoyl-CoA hydratase
MTTKKYETVLVEKQDGITWLIMNRPDKRNAMSPQLHLDMDDALDELSGDPETQVLVLTGAGEAFCAGADLTAIETLSPRLLAGEGPLGFTRRVPSKPTIAAVDGWAVAGGLELAIWCDLRIVSPRSQLGCLERRFGVPLVDGGTWRLPRIVGHGRAMDLILTGRLVGADEAIAMGLATSVSDDPVAAALELAEVLAGFPQATMLSDRASVYDGYGRPRDEALDIEARYGREVLVDAAQGAARFADGAGRGGSTR